LPPKPKTPCSALGSLAKIAARQRVAALGFSQRGAMMLCQGRQKHEGVLVGPQREDRRVVNKEVPTSETAGRFGRVILVAASSKTT
jgi:hypothetical protein